MATTTVNGAGTYRSTTTLNRRGGEHWADVNTSYWDPTPADTNRLSMSETRYILAGMGLRYKYGGTHRYGVVSNVVQDQYIEIRGYPFNTGQDITELAATGFVSMLHYTILGAYGDTIDEDILASKANQVEIWGGPTSYIVAMRKKHFSGAGSPAINITTNTGDVFTYNVPVTDTLAYASSVLLGANYQINYGERIKIRCTSNDAAANVLTLMLTIVPF